MTKTYSILLLSLMFSGNLIFAQSPEQDREAKHRTEIPLEPKGNCGLFIEHNGFALSYDTITNCPKWVAWELTEEEAYANQVKRVNDFRGDPLVPPLHRVEGYDYKETGYDRGHMCPAADMKWSAESMSECFYMSNICPQAPKLNQQWWEHLEKACRRWASNEGNIFICCGPIFDDDKEASYIGNEVKIRVPDRFFKVILSLRKDKEKAIGFIYSNSSDRQTMEDAAVSVDSVETVTGYNFFSTIGKKLEKKVESNYNLRKWE